MTENYISIKNIFLATVTFIFIQILDTLTIFCMMVITWILDFITGLFGATGGYGLTLLLDISHSFFIIMIFLVGIVNIIHVHSLEDKKINLEVEISYTSKLIAYLFSDAVKISAIICISVFLSYILTLINVSAKEWIDVIIKSFFTFYVFLFVIIGLYHFLITFSKKLEEREKIASYYEEIEQDRIRSIELHR